MKSQSVTGEEINAHGIIFFHSDENVYDVKCHGKSSFHTRKFVDWLDWLDWLGWLGWLDWLAGQLVDWLIGWFDWLIWLIGLTGWVNWLIDLIDWFDWLIWLLAFWLAGWMARWLTDLQQFLYIVGLFCLVLVLPPRKRLNYTIRADLKEMTNKQTSRTNFGTDEDQWYRQ